MLGVPDPPTRLLNASSFSRVLSAVFENHLRGVGGEGIMRCVMKKYAEELVRYGKMGISLDFSKIDGSAAPGERLAPAVKQAFADMTALEGGAISNPDENRMVGHYWLRNSALAPTPELRSKIDDALIALKAFAADVLSGRILAPGGETFTSPFHPYLDAAISCPVFTSREPPGK